MFENLTLLEEFLEYLLSLEGASQMERKYFVIKSAFKKFASPFFSLFFSPVHILTGREKKVRKTGQEAQDSEENVVKRIVMK